MCIHTVLKLSIDQIFKSKKVVFIFIDKYSTTTVSNVTILRFNSVVNIGSLYNICPSLGPLPSFQILEFKNKYLDDFK